MRGQSFRDEARGSHSYWMPAKMADGEFYSFVDPRDNNILIKL